MCLFSRNQFLETITQHINQLLKRCLKGDEQAQFAVYKQYYRAMYNTALRIVNDTFEAEDIMQESFLSAFTKLDSFSGNVTFGAWLKKIVINEALMFKRKDFTSIYKVEQIDEVTEFVSVSPDLTDEMELIELIDQLPDGYKTVFLLHVVDGYSHKEISEMLGISEGTSKIIACE